MSVFSKVYEQMWEEVKKHEEFENRRTQHFLETVFYSTVIGSFSYEGDIPEFIKPIPSYIEESFFMSSKLGYFYHEGKPYITPCYPMGVLMENGMYSQYTCIFRNGKQVIKNYNDIEVCDNNSLGLPSRVLVDEILDKCVRALRSVDMSLERASTPSINCVTDERLADLITKAVSESVNRENPMALITATSFKGEALHKYDLFDNRAQDVLALWDIFVRYKNLFFSSYGINNVEISKSERLTRGESESNTEIIRFTLFYDLYEHRKDWFDRIFNHFGDRIEVIINRNFETVSAMTMTNDEKKEMMKMVIAPYAEQINNSNDENSEENSNEKEGDNNE